MSMSYATNKLRVPPGFEHLLEGLAREILREQPKNLLEFAAQYFRNKLQERDGEAGESISLLPFGDETAPVPQITSQEMPNEAVVSEAPVTQDTPQPPQAIEEVEKAVDGDEEEEMEQEEEGKRSGGGDGEGESEGGGECTESELERVSSGGGLVEKDVEKGTGEGDGEGEVEEVEGEGEGEVGKGAPNEEVAVEENEDRTNQSTDDIEPKQSIEEKPDDTEGERDPISDAVTEQEPTSSASQQDLSDVASTGGEEEETAENQTD